MNTMKRLLSILLMLCLLFSCTAFAEDEDDDDYSLFPEDEQEDGTLIEEEELSEEDMEFEIGDGEEAIEEDLDSLERDPDINPDDLEINPNLPDNVINILLIGVDMREKDLDASSGLLHNDVTMVLSVDTSTGSVKLTSILRDLYTDIPGYKSKGRLNEAYSRGSGKSGANGENRGAMLTMRTINHNFDLNVSQYVVINFYGLASIIDAIGGVDVDLIKGEANAINAYLKKNGKRMTYDLKGNENREPLKVETSVQHLDGIQAVMYARLRTKMATGDFARTARQRHLLELLLKQVVADIDMNKLANLIKVAYPYVKTNISAGTMLNLALGVLQGDILSKLRDGGDLIEQHRVPLDKGYSYGQNESGGSVIIMSSKQWANSVQSIHYFIYGDYYPAK